MDFMKNRDSDVITLFFDSFKRMFTVLILLISLTKILTLVKNTYKYNRFLEFYFILFHFDL